MDHRPNATRSSRRSVTDWPVTGLRSPGTRFDKKYFTSPLNTLRATIKQCRRVGKPAAFFRHRTAHLTSHTTGPRLLSLMRYRCHDCSRKTGEYFSKLRTSHDGRRRATRGKRFFRPRFVDFFGAVRKTVGFCVQP